MREFLVAVQEEVWPRADRESITSEVMKLIRREYLAATRDLLFDDSSRGSRRAQRFALPVIPPRLLRRLREAIVCEAYALESEPSRSCLWQGERLFYRAPIDELVVLLSAMRRIFVVMHRDQTQWVISNRPAPSAETIGARDTIDARTIDDRETTHILV